MTCTACGGEVEMSSRVEKQIRSAKPVQCWVCYRLHMTAIERDPNLPPETKGETDE